MYCVDTDVVISTFRGDKALKNKLSESDISITTITLCELFQGAYIANNPEKSLKLIYEFMKQVDIITLDEKSCEIFGRDFKFLREHGKLTQEFDLLIASIVKSYNFILVTRNKKDFQNIPDLKIEEW